MKRLVAPALLAISLPAFGQTLGSTPGEFSAYARSEIERWGRVINASGVRPE